jgi:hypothetical protein
MSMMIDNIQLRRLGSRGAANDDGGLLQGRRVRSGSRSAFDASHQFEIR